MKTEKISTITPEHYIGDKVEVIKAEYVQLQHGKCIRLTGSVMELKEDDTLPDGKVLTASKILGLAENGEGDVVVAIGSGAEKFLLAKKIDISKLPEYEEGASIDMLLGMKCTVQKNPKNNFLDLI